MSDIKKLLGKLLEENSLAEEQAAASNINVASKQALKGTTGTLTTSQLKANVAADPAHEIEQHLLAAYNIIKANPQLKLGPVTTAIKAFYSKKEQTVSSTTTAKTNAVPPTPIKMDK